MREEVDPYEAFLRRKNPHAQPSGFECDLSGMAHLWDWQQALVSWLLFVGRSAAFADTGLGKGRMSLEWARQVYQHTGKPVLVFTPLAVGRQMLREAERCNIDGVRVVRDQADAGSTPIAITNYERLHLFEPQRYRGVVLDESSILKAFMGKTKRELQRRFEDTLFKLAATATPAPNDHLELGNHAEFLRVLTSHQMIARWFLNDTTRVGTYRLKGHAIEPFWNWVCSWARCVGLPSDLGPYSDAGYVLPPLHMHYQTVGVDLLEGRNQGDLFRMVDANATELHRERRRTAAFRADRAAELVMSEPDEPYLVWVETDYDAREVMRRIPGAVEVSGSMTPEQKADRLLGFSDGDFRVLVTKPKIAGFGLNWQHCARAVFAGPSYSYEGLYQAIRRNWRFGQGREVHAHLVMAATEQAVWAALERKGREHEEMKLQMFAASRRAAAQSAERHVYQPHVQARLPSWMTYLPETTA